VLHGLLGEGRSAGTVLNLHRRHIRTDIGTAIGILIERYDSDRH
jgi:hypothetical protein